MIQTSFKRNPSLNFAMIQKEKCRPTRKVVGHLPAVSESAIFFYQTALLLFRGAFLCLPICVRFPNCLAKVTSALATKEDPHTV